MTQYKRTKDNPIKYSQNTRNQTLTPRLSINVIEANTKEHLLDILDRDALPNEFAFDLQKMN